MTWSEFFQMGGYGLYVWASYGLALLVFLANVLLPMVRLRALAKRVAPPMPGKDPGNHTDHLPGEHENQA